MNYIKMPAGLLALFATAAMLTGCFKGGGEQPIDNTPKDGVTLNIAVPGMATMTRSWEENQIEDLDVIVFDSSGEFAGHYTATEIHQNAAQTTYQYFISGLELTGDFEVVVIANYPAVVAEALTKAGVEGGECFTKEQFVKYLEFTARYGITPFWWVDSFPIPMYGETKWDGAFSPATQAVSVKLTRAIAHVEVRMLALRNYDTKTPYHIQGISSNFSCKGMLRPNYEYPLKPNLPNNREIRAGNMEPWIDNGIYIMEAPAATDDSDGFYMIVKLNYSGVPDDFCWYRIDMTWDGSIPGTVRGEPMPILRNYKYYVTINKVLGPGSSLEEAQQGKGELTNLDYTIHVEDQGHFEKVAYDGKYMLGVQKASFDVSADEQVVKFLVSSNYPYYWTADATYVTWLILALGNEDLGSLRWDDKVTSNSATGFLSVKVGKNETTVDREAVFNITSGHLSIPIKIKQSAQSAVSIEIQGADYVIANTYSLNWDVDDYATKGIMIKWTPANTELKISSTTEGTHGDFVYGEGSNSLDDYTSLWGGTAIFNIRPDENTSYPGSYITRYTFTVSSNTAVSKSLELSKEIYP